MGYQAKIIAGGKIVLPAELRRELGLKEGDTVLVDRDGETLRIRSRAAAIREAQAIVRRYVPEGVSLVDELIAERRAEASRE
jgi:AbrB family looped-hinge helix DNA binding protein